MTISTEVKIAAGVVAAMVVGGVILKKKIEDAGGLGGFVQETVADATSGAVEAVGGAATGVVIGIGDSVGIPRTSMNECERAIAEGRTWDASFACPASRFIKYVTTGK